MGQVLRDQDRPTIKLDTDYFSEAFSRDHFVEVLDALHYNERSLSRVLRDIRTILRGYDWATESRGPYAYDDDGYMREFGNCIDAIDEKITKALDVAQQSEAHNLCCNTYAHIRGGDTVSVQLKFEFEEVDYIDFVEHMVKMVTIEGRDNGLPPDKN